MADRTETRIERWKRENRAHLRRYQRIYYRERKRAGLNERLARVRKQMETASGDRAKAVALEAKEIGLKLDRLRLDERAEKGAA
jgi:hypothetical protein